MAPPINTITPLKSKVTSGGTFHLSSEDDSDSNVDSTENESASETSNKRPRLQGPIVYSPTAPELAAINEHTSQVKSDCDQSITTFAEKLCTKILDHKHLQLLGSIDFCRLYNRQNQTGFMQLMDWVSVGYWLCRVKIPSSDVAKADKYTDFTSVTSLNHKIEMIIKRVSGAPNETYQLLDRDHIAIRLREHSTSETYQELLQSLVGSEFEITKKSRTTSVGGSIQLNTHRDYIRCYRDCFEWFASFVLLPPGIKIGDDWHQKQEFISLSSMESGTFNDWKQLVQDYVKQMELFFNSVFSNTPISAIKNICNITKKKTDPIGSFINVARLEKSININVEHRTIDLSFEEKDYKDRYGSEFRSYLNDSIRY